MSEKEILTNLEHYILKRLHYGCEVLVKNEKEEKPKIHWFENIGSDGFYTTENSGKPIRFISISGENWIDFEKLKPWLSMINKGVL